MSWVRVVDYLPEAIEMVLVLRKYQIVDSGEIVPWSVWLSWLELDGSWRDNHGIFKDVVYWHSLPKWPEAVIADLPEVDDEPD